MRKRASSKASETFLPRRLSSFCFHQLAKYCPPDLSDIDMASEVDAYLLRHEIVPTLQRCNESHIVHGIVHVCFLLNSRSPCHRK